MNEVMLRDSVLCMRPFCLLLIIFLPQLSTNLCALVECLFFWGGGARGGVGGGRFGYCSASLHRTSLTPEPPSSSQPPPSSGRLEWLGRTITGSFHGDDQVTIAGHTIQDYENAAFAVRCASTCSRPQIANRHMSNVLS